MNRAGVSASPDLGGAGDVTKADDYKRLECTVTAVK
jgi:hypothetical protein